MTLFQHLRAKIARWRFNREVDRWIMEDREEDQEGYLDSFGELLNPRSRVFDWPLYKKLNYAREAMRYDTLNEIWDRDPFSEEESPSTEPIQYQPYLGDYLGDWSKL